MKKLFGRAGGGSSAAAKKDGAGPLTNKTVQVGPHTVLVEHVLGLGGYGEIYRAVNISSGQRFALKVDRGQAVRCATAAASYSHAAEAVMRVKCLDINLHNGGDSTQRRLPCLASLCSRCVCAAPAP